MEENIEQKNWWGRNWKWALPTGGCMFVILMIVVFAGSIFYGVSSMMNDSQAHIDAMEKVNKNEELAVILGAPIETNGMAGGSVNYSNGFKTAQLTIPIKGPKGEATIRVEGEGVETNWNYSKMIVYLKDSDTEIDLLSPNETFDE